MKWNIEKSKKNDCKALVEFITKTWNETYRGIVNDEFLDSLKKTEEKRYNSFINYFDEKNNIKYIIKKDSKIIAFLKLIEGREEKDKKYIELQSLYVLKEYQNNGIGKRLIQKAFEESKKLGYKKMFIGCLEENKSNEFYKKMGGKFIKKREFKLIRLKVNNWDGKLLKFSTPIIDFQLLYYTPAELIVDKIDLAEAFSALILPKPVKSKSLLLFTVPYLVCT